LREIAREAALHRRGQPALLLLVGELVDPEQVRGGEFVQRPDALVAFAMPAIRLVSESSRSSAARRLADVLGEHVGGVGLLSIKVDGGGGAEAEQQEAAQGGGGEKAPCEGGWGHPVILYQIAVIRIGGTGVPPVICDRRDAGPTGL